MKKDALINIIINDLKEVELLMEAFKGEDDVNPVFVNLAKTKLKSIEDELSLLNREFGKHEAGTVNAAKEIGSNKEAEVIISEERILEEESEAVKIKGKPAGVVEEDNKKVVPEKTEEPVVNLKKEEREVEKERKVEVVKEEKRKPDVEERKEPKPAEDRSEVKPHVKAETKVVDEKARLGDVLQQDKSALNERISRKDAGDMKFAKPVKDVKKAMGINDRFFYQRELFNSNSDLFNQTLDQINSMNSFDDAKNFLLSNFKWDETSDTTDAFLKIVKRRFL